MKDWARIASRARSTIAFRERRSKDSPLERTHESLQVSVHAWRAENEKRKAGGRVTEPETAENKQLLQRIFSELSKGNAKPFVESWADDFSWTVIGTTKWSKTYRGK